MIEVTDEMKNLVDEELGDIDTGYYHWEEFRDATIKRIIELHEANKPEPVGLGEEWMPCIKLPVIVHVRNQRQGEQHVSTREGITPVKPDDLIMRGVSGEEYPIGSEIFNKTYTLDTTPPTREPLSKLEIEKCQAIAANSYRSHKLSAQEQKVMPSESYEEHLARAIEQAHGIT